MAGVAGQLEGFVVEREVAGDRVVEVRYADVIDELLPIRRVLQRFGGSHAQRDVLQRTLLEASVQDGQHSLASALLSERVAVRATSVYGWTRQARLFDALEGHAKTAAEAARWWPSLSEPPSPA